MVLVWAKELFEVWKEAKSELPDGENWIDITWDKLSQKDKDEYLKTAQRNLSQLSAVHKARLKQAVDDGAREIFDELENYCNHHLDEFKGWNPDAPVTFSLPLIKMQELLSKYHYKKGGTQ